MTTPTPADRRARLGVAALFFTNGAIYANLLPRLPEIKDGLGLGDAIFGAGVAAMSVGALAAGLAAATLIRRFGAGLTAAITSVLTAAGVLAAATAQGWWWFAIAMLITGAADAITDVAQNSDGLRVQASYGRSIINSFHAAWSMGAVSGGLAGGLAGQLGLPVAVHLGITGGLFSLMALLVLPWLRHRPEVVTDSSSPRAHGAAPRAASRPSVRLVLVITALVLIACSGTFVEDATATWSALYLGRDLGAPISIAALGFVALQGAQFIGRITGDRLVDRFGQRTMARTGGLLVALGMGLALAFPTVPGTIAGFGAAGFGVATLVPAAMHAADRLPGLRAGTGLTLVSWLMRLGILTSPLVVGLVAEASNLRTGLSLMVLAGLLVIGISGVLARRAR